MNERTGFLARHGPVIAGVALPIVVVVAFVVARMVPRALVDDPRYDLLFAVASEVPIQPRQASCEIGAHEGRLRARWTALEQPAYAQVQRVYRLHPATGVLTELTVPEPPLEGFEGTRDLYFEGFEDVRLDTSPRAPDGYEFENGYSSGSGLFGELFGGRSRGPRSSIKKSGRVIELPQTSPNVYGYAVFLGWAVPVEERR